ncbi:MAG: HNH endonuclease [Clostridia bacterium]|nr:HNH endonuclease [Clostridia bacterium]
MESRYKESDPFYHRTAWKRVRALALSRDGGMCQDCMDRLRAGYGIRPNRATMVHHVIPVSERPDLALTLSNLRSLCAECHNREHPEKAAGRKGPEKPGHGMRVVKV